MPLWITKAKDIDWPTDNTGDSSGFCPDVEVTTTTSPEETTDGTTSEAPTTTTIKPIELEPCSLSSEQFAAAWEKFWGKVKTDFDFTDAVHATKFSVANDGKSGIVFNFDCGDDLVGQFKCKKRDEKWTIPRPPKGKPDFTDVHECYVRDILPPVIT